MNITPEQIDNEIEIIAARLRPEFEQLIGSLEITDEDARWNARCIIGERIGNALTERAVKLMDDDEGLMAALRPHTTDQHSMEEDDDV